MSQDIWQYSTVHNSVCKVIEEQTLWGQTVCRIWLPNQNAVANVCRSTLRPLNASVQPEIEAWRIAYVAAAAKVAEVLEGSTSATDDHVLLAPMESNVIPLPHQIRVLSRAISGDRVRYLLADEVGLGKTIEAGLIMRELKLRGLVRRTLVVAPKGLATQWVAEMHTHLSEKFRLVRGEDINALHRFAPGNDGRSSAWSMFDQVVVTLDSVKPVERRRGWAPQRVADYNRERFESLITAEWDLVIVDEAHRLGGGTDQVARYKLGCGLAASAPYLLLLSATPHQGKSDAFHRLMSLLDENAFPDADSVTRDRVAPYVIRTEKRKAIDADGQPLFTPRRTEIASVKWETRHRLQQQLYEAVTEYVREGYNKALKEKKHHIGFLMILMQRLVVSSTRAIRTTLERRQTTLMDGQRQIDLNLEDFENGFDGIENLEEFYDMDGQELLDQLLKSRVLALQSERSQVEALLDAAVRCECAGPDAKAETLIEWIYKLQTEETEPNLKVLIFTEFIPTQQMLTEFLEARGISVAILNGSMGMEERKHAQDAFRDRARVLVSTDAGGEGLNLQFAHIIINYDIPWNPMRLEQRIGRVDRIGQRKTVRAINFVFEASVEYRVLEVLEQKLSVIFDEFGIDKTGDVLDSAQAGELIEDVYASAILNPDDIEPSVENAVARIRDEIQLTRDASGIFGDSETPDAQTAERLRSHPLPHWIERMTVGYLNSHGGTATRKRSWWDLRWPDGKEQHKCVFSIREANRLSGSSLLCLEDRQIRDLATSIPQIVAGLPVPRVVLSGLPLTVVGLWGLFEIRLQAGLHQAPQFLRIPLARRGYASVFLNEEGTQYLLTAQHIWDVLQTADPQVLDVLDHDESITAFDRLWSCAEQAGKDVYRTLHQAHIAAISREHERGSAAFNSMRKSIERVGLPEVRRYRLGCCDSNEAHWKNELLAVQQTVPEIRPLLLMRIDRGGAK